jgi:hypothetical protein
MQPDSMLAIDVSSIPVEGMDCYIVDIGSVDEVYGNDGILERPENSKHISSDRVYIIPEPIK